MKLGAPEHAHVRVAHRDSGAAHAFLLGGRRRRAEFGNLESRTREEVRVAVLAVGGERHVAAAAARSGASGASDGSGEAVRCMTNVADFGPEVYRMSFAQAVAQRIVVPLGLLVYDVSDTYARMCARLPELVVVAGERRVSQANAAPQRQGCAAPQ